MLASSSQWTQQHIGFEQSEFKVSERFSWYTLLKHLTCDVSVWLQSLNLDVICQLSCHMFAQVHLSAQLSLVNFHVHYLICNMLAWLHSTAQMRISSVACICSAADQHLGCNQSSAAAICEYSAQLEHRLSAGMRPAKSQLSCLSQQGLHMIAFSVICERLMQSVSCGNAMSAQLQCFSSNVTFHCVHNRQLLAAISHSKCPQLCLDTILLSRGNLAQLQSDKGYVVC